jgi:hypothetical protein
LNLHELERRCNILKVKNDQCSDQRMFSRGLGGQRMKFDECNPRQSLGVVTNLSGEQPSLRVSPPVGPGQEIENLGEQTQQRDSKKPFTLMLNLD